MHSTKKVCFFKNDGLKKIGQYHIESFSDSIFFPNLTVADKFNTGIRRLFNQNIQNPQRAVLYAEEVHRHWSNKTPWYMGLVEYFKEKYSDFDAIIMSTYCPIHPEVIASMNKPIKILGFIDEPGSSYIRGVPYLWAFDGAFYISPSYDDFYCMKDQIRSWGCAKSYFWPLCSNVDGFSTNNRFFENRSIDIAYVGNYYGSKVDRLIELKKHFGSRMALHGRWPMKGLIGLARPLIGKPVFPQIVHSLTNDERTALYLDTKIGFNMHLSLQPRETGNMRMYEVPSHGMMLLCDKAAKDMHNDIFESGKEAIYYDSIDEAIELAEYFISNDDKRIEIAAAGYSRSHSSFNNAENLKNFLDWVFTLRSEEE